jgi:hypothetical protein
MPNEVLDDGVSWMNVGTTDVVCSKVACCPRGTTRVTSYYIVGSLFRAGL